MSEKLILEDDEVIIETFKGDLLCRVGLFRRDPHSGTFTITNQRIHYESYVFITQSIVDIYYEDIDILTPVNFLFIKTVIKITVPRGYYKIIVSKRDEHLRVIQEQKMLNREANL